MHYFFDCAVSFDGNQPISEELLDCQPRVQQTEVTWTMENADERDQEFSPVYYSSTNIRAVFRGEMNQFSSAEDASDKA